MLARPGYRPESHATGKATRIAPIAPPPASSTVCSDGRRDLGERRGIRRRRASARRSPAARPWRRGRVRTSAPSASGVARPSAMRAARMRAAAADAGVPAPAARRRLDHEEHEAERREHHAERGGRRAGERRLVGDDDRRGEGVEPDEGERAVLREQVQCDDEAAAEHREAELREDDPPEHRPRAEAERPGGFLQRRVEPADRRQRREVDERVVRERGHEQPAAEAVDRRDRARPAVARHERRDRERGDEQYGEEPASRAGRCARRARRRRRRARSSRARRARAAARC